MENREVETALRAAFLIEGLHEAGYDACIKAASPNQGCIDMVEEIVCYAPTINRLIEAASSTETIKQNGFPGVFDYEVTSPFGKWLGQSLLESGEFPSKQLALSWLTKEVGGFFSQALPPDEAQTVLEAVRRATAAEGMTAEEEAAWRECGADEIAIRVIAERGGYHAIMASEERQLELQDVLDHLVQCRLWAVRNALRELGWGGEMYAPFLKKECGGEQATCRPKISHVGAGRNVVSLGFLVMLDGYEMPAQPDVIVDDMHCSTRDMATRIDSWAQKLFAREGDEDTARNGSRPRF